MVTGLELATTGTSRHGHQAGTGHHGGHQDMVTELALTIMGTSGHGHWAGTSDLRDIRAWPP